MTYENDPNRLDRLRSSYDNEGSSAPLIALALIVVFIVALVLTYRPREDTPRVTENAPRTERPVTPSPTTPPAAKPEPKPVPTTPQ
jgi:hypothetical protein